MTVSGMPQREDHEVVVAALAAALGVPEGEMVLPG